MSAWPEILAALIDGSTQTSAGDKVRFDSAIDADKYPFVIVRRVAVEREFGLDNSLHTMKETFQIECWGEDREQASTLEDEVVALLIAAGLPPDANGPDGLDPEVDVRASVVFVSTFS